MTEHTVNQIEIKELMKDRAAFYAFLSTAYFEEITLDFLTKLRDERPVLEGELGTFVHSLGDADLEVVRTDLAAEYARVFLGMSRTPVSPYESVYSSDLHILMQEARDDVLREYRLEGYGVQEGINLPEDHVAFEFGFMSCLCQKTSDALETGSAQEADRLLDVQARFITNHLINWVPSLCEDIQKRAKTSFYRGLAQLTLSFIQEDHVMLLDEEAQSSEA